MHLFSLLLTNLSIYYDSYIINLIAMKSNQTCLYYMQGRCKFGQKCYYSHQGFLQALIIRHAESQFNKITTKFPDWTNMTKQLQSQLHFNKELIDCVLSKQGVEQAQALRLSSDYIGQKREVDIVFVSPLTRTIQTAEIIMKANKLKVKNIIVLPQLTEVLSKICDFGSSIKHKRSQYKHFNFDQMERFLKQNKHLKGEEQWQDALVDMGHQSSISKQKSFGQRYLQILSNIFPTPLENSERCFNRSLRALEIMKQISQKLKAKKVLVVSHNRILKYLDGRFSKGRGQSFQNCEVRKLIF